jgi:hypothetical protein
MKIVKWYLVAAGLLGVVSTARADIVHIQLGAAAVNIGPNVTNFDTLTSSGNSLSLNLLPGVTQALAFYDLNFTPSCSSPACDGIFARGINFGFVEAQNITLPGSGSGIYVQPVLDSISHANTAESSHVLSLSTGGGVVIDLDNGERVTITVPSQTFDGRATGDTPASLGVGASFLLSTVAVPEPSSAETMLIASIFFVIAARRFSRD